MNKPTNQQLSGFQIGVIFVLTCLDDYGDDPDWNLRFSSYIKSEAIQKQFIDNCDFPDIDVNDIIKCPHCGRVAEQSRWLEIDDLLVCFKCQQSFKQEDGRL